jgi:hypothetical protein
MTRKSRGIIGLTLVTLALIAVIVAVVAGSSKSAAYNAGYAWGQAHALDSGTVNCLGPAMDYNATHKGNPSALISQFEAGCSKGVG